MKMKKKTKVVSDRVNSKNESKKLNPFEVHVNRKKFNILGQRKKTEKGLPGIARSRALKKRKTTLLQEYRLRGKNNLFVDRRIGEKDVSMTADDKILARYTTERMRYHSNKSLYNLDDNEVLTHRGESLADIEKFEDPKSDEDDDVDEDGRNRSGKLDKHFVSEAHFGGGMLKKVVGDKSRKDLIDEMIAESKMRKAEQQKTREQTLDLTEKLDSEWQQLLPLVHSSKPRDDGPTLSSDRIFASYDKLSKELRFEARGKATDKLKSEEALAKEEKKKLEELEQQRLARMRGDSKDASGPKHRSADDLDDGFDYYADSEKKRKNINDYAESDSNDNADYSRPVEQDGSESEGDSESIDEDVGNNENNAVGEPDGDNNEEGVSSEDDEGDDSDDDLCDLRESDETGDEAEEAVKKKETKKVANPDELSDVKKALKVLPFTLTVPDTYTEFSKMCFGKDPAYQAVVLERMVKSNHPSLPDGSRQKLITLYKYCLQHLHDVSTDPNTIHSTFAVLEKISPWLYELAHFAPATTSSILCDVIKEKYANFLSSSRRFPFLDTLVFFKLVSILYPTSDLRHRIVTPTLVFMQHILASCYVRRSINVATGLFIATLILEFTTMSKRFTPEAINWLRGLLRSAHSTKHPVPALPPFKSKTEFSMLISSSSPLKEEVLTPLTTKDLLTSTDSDEFKLRAVNLALNLLLEFSKNFQTGEESIIFEPFTTLLTLDNYSPCLHISVTSLSIAINKLRSKKLYRLVAIKKRPKPLRLYEPKIEEVYTFRKKKTMSKEKEEHERLMHKYKKEVKGALREIRRDNAFLSKIHFGEIKASDLERKRKVKEIFGDAAQQAGELRKLKRQK